MINGIFQELLHEGVLANYINTFVIPVKTKKELEEQTIKFLKVAEKHSLYYKWSKYDFDAKEIPIFYFLTALTLLFSICTSSHLTTTPKISTKIKEVKSFLEFANFYRCFIKNFSHTAKPLNNVKRKKN